MIEFFQMLFVTNPGLIFIGGAVAVTFFIMIPVYFLIFNDRVNKLSYRKAIHAIGFVSAIGIGLYGIHIMFNDIIIPSSERMSECEVSRISIRVQELGIDTTRDITVCRHRVDFESEEFTPYTMQMEDSATWPDRNRQIDRCIDVDADLYVNHDVLVAVNDTMPVQVCIKYGDLSYSKLQTAINGTPSK